MADKIIIGSHIGMGSPRFFLGTVEEALSQNETTFMFYTGAPQNSIRTPLANCKIKEGLDLLKTTNININDVVVHAPYLINLGNIDPEKNQLGRDLLSNELIRTEGFGVNKIVLHPGLHVHNGEEIGLKSIVDSLDTVLDNDQTKVIICLETMAGKGTELGKTFEEIAYIIKHSRHQERLGVCLDTCHINDAGYDVSNVDTILDEFDRIIGLDRLKVIHLNDSHNVRGSHKDRHANIGQGTIGFKALYSWVHNERLKNIPKILETPWVNKTTMPYKKEIEMLITGNYDPDFLTKF